MNVHRPAVFLVIFALCLVAAASTAPALALAPPDPTAPPGWTTSCIYCPKRFDAPGEHYVAIDAAGHPHLAYGGDALYYALRDEAGWHTETVDSTAGTGVRASLALAPGGTVGIAYYSRASGALMFARRVGQAWETETVDLAGDLTRARLSRRRFVGSLSHRFPGLAQRARSDVRDDQVCLSRCARLAQVRRDGLAAECGRHVAGRLARRHASHCL